MQGEELGLVQGLEGAVRAAPGLAPRTAAAPSQTETRLMIAIVSTGLGQGAQAAEPELVQTGRSVVVSLLAMLLVITKDIPNSRGQGRSRKQSGKLRRRRPKRQQRQRRQSAMPPWLQLQSHVGLPPPRALPWASLRALVAKIRRAQRCAARVIMHR